MKSGNEEPRPKAPPPKGGFLGISPPPNKPWAAPGSLLRAKRDKPLGRGAGGIRKIPIPLFAALVLLSCASSPRSTPHGDRGEFASLPPGALAYFYIDVPRARPFLDALPLGDLDSGQMPRILDKTESAVAAVYPEGAGRRFFAAAKGSYPRFRAGLSFAFSPAWKKVRSETGPRYWRSARDRLSISLGSGRALVSDGDLFTQSPGTESPGGFGELRPGAVLAGWTTSAAAVNRFIESLAIPIQIPADRLIFGVYAAADDRGERTYEAVLRMETPSVSQARGLVSIFSMARMFIAGMDLDGFQGSIVRALFANLPVREEADLIIHTGLMDEGEIALLFTMFTVYSN